MLAHPEHHVVLAVDSLGKGALAQALRAVPSLRRMCSR